MGVCVDGSLKFDSHVEKVTNKVYRALGFIIRVGRNFKQPDIFLHLYNTLVVPHLDYCSVVWSPHYIRYADTLESVQRRFTRHMFIKFGWSYRDYDTRLNRLKLLPLCKRHILMDQMTLYYVMRDNIIVDPARSCIALCMDRSTRSRDLFVEKTWRLRSTYVQPL